MAEISSRLAQACSHERRRIPKSGAEAARLLEARPSAGTALILPCPPGQSRLWGQPDPHVGKETLLTGGSSTAT